jgi:hypothetical protein
MSYTITATDFQYLWNTATNWKGNNGLDWKDQEERFEKTGDCDEKINWEFKKVYWIGKEYSSVIFAKIFLTSINQTYQILWDLNGCEEGEWVVLTDYSKN